MHAQCLLVIQIQRHSMANKVLSSGLKTELLINRFHALLVQIDAYGLIQQTLSSPDITKRSVLQTLVSNRVIAPPSLQEFKEFLGPPLLK